MPYIIASWIEAMRGKINNKELFDELTRSLPPLCSVTFTRQCNLACKHCVYPSANKADLQKNDLKRIQQAVQATFNAGVRDLIHVGRTLQPSHLPILSHFQDQGMSLNLIDNGSAARLIPKIKDAGIFFNGGIDISVDGYAKTHEKQRGKGSWQMVLEGITALPQVADHISLTGTASSANWETIADDLRRLRTEHPAIRKVQLTTTSPARHHLSRMNLTREQMRRIFANMLLHSEQGEQHLLLYWLEDLAAILDLLPKEYVTQYISIEWHINQLHVSFFPQAIVPSEEFAIDSNGRHILPFGLDWHLAERPEHWEMRDERINTDPDESYRKLVRKYADTLGRQILQQEKGVLKQYFA